MNASTTGSPQPFLVALEYVICPADRDPVLAMETVRVSLQDEGGGRFYRISQDDHEVDLDIEEVRHLNSAFRLLRKADPHFPSSPPLPPKAAEIFREEILRAFTNPAAASTPAPNVPAHCRGIASVLDLVADTLERRCALGLEEDAHDAIEFIRAVAIDLIADAKPNPVLNGDSA
jgi:hypothetical protein